MLNGQKWPMFPWNSHSILEYSRTCSRWYPRAATANPYVSHKVVQESVNYQVVLDEKPETFNNFVLWIFHSPEFVVARGKACFSRPLADGGGNVEDLLRMAQKYEIPTLTRDICVPTINQ
jgi:hypothetical protein